VLAGRIDAGERQTWTDLAGLADGGPASLGLDPARVWLSDGGVELLRWVLNQAASGGPVTAVELAVAAMRDRRLWNTSAGDDVPALLDIDGVSVVVVEDGRVVSGQRREGIPTVYVSRVNRDHYQALAPAAPAAAPAAGPSGQSAAALLDPSTSSEARGLEWSQPRARAARAGVVGVPSPAVRAAVDMVAVEGEAVDCVVGVGRVLVAIGPSPSSWDDLVLTPRSWTVGRWLGGHFQDGSLDGLGDLRPGHVTAVRVQPPGRVAHMVIVERLDGERYLVIDPTLPGDDRFAAFRPAMSGAELPSQLRAPVRLVRQVDGGLGQLAVPGGALRRGADRRSRRGGE
jgi:hypothetical protein